MLLEAERDAIRALRDYVPQPVSPSPEELREARLEAGVGVRALARALGVAASTLSAWETGSRRPRPEQRLRLREAVEILKGGDDA
jgi:DNA-binding transcriptional regulator YiaG